MILRGPVVQPTLLSIMLRFRIHNIVLTADVEKMYRQIKVDSDDSNLQRILFRMKPDEHVQEFKLLTVTYGTKSAPFLATQCLKALAYSAPKNYYRKNNRPGFLRWRFNDWRSYSWRMF